MPVFHELLVMSFYASLILIVPGPTNTLLFSSGLKVGVRRTLPLVVAEAMGYALAILTWGFFLLSFAASRPWLLDGIKLLCAAYLLWLAFKLWRNSHVLHDTLRRPAHFFEVFLATLLNPKAFLFASSVFPLSAFQSTEQFAWAMGVFLIALGPIGILWASLGKILTSRQSWSNHTATFQRSASVLLGVFSMSIAYSTMALQDDLPQRVAHLRVLLPMA